MRFAPWKFWYADELAGDYVVTSIDLPDDLQTTALSLQSLPHHWDATRSIAATADIGSEWAKSLKTSVLVVPSAVIREERNYLLNPHSDFARIRFMNAKPFRFDDRLRRSLRQ